MTQQVAMRHKAENIIQNFILHLCLFSPWMSFLSASCQFTFKSQGTKVMGFQAVEDAGSVSTVPAASGNQLVSSVFPERSREQARGAGTHCRVGGGASRLPGSVCSAPLHQWPQGAVRTGLWSLALESQIRVGATLSPPLFV